MYSNGQVVKIVFVGGSSRSGTEAESAGKKMFIDPEMTAESWPYGMADVPVLLQNGGGSTKLLSMRPKQKFTACRSS